MTVRRQDRDLREIRLLFPHAKPERANQRFAPEIEDAIRIVHPAIAWIPRRVNLPATPAAGAEFDFLPPAGVEWRVIAVSAVFTTSALVATRTVKADFHDGAASAGLISSAQTQVASQAFRYTFAVAGIEHAVRAGNQVLIALPQGLTLVGEGRGDSHVLRLRSSVTNLQVTDQWGNPNGFVLERQNVALR